VFAAGQPEMLGSLPGIVLVLALVPPNCRCLTDLRQLTIQAPPATIYLVGVRGARVDRLARPLGLGAAQAVDDTDNLLPARYQVTALTAVVVKNDGSVLDFIPDHHGFQIRGAVRALIPASAASLVPASSSPAPPTASSSPAG
jgi:hypothetical protein